MVIYIQIAADSYSSYKCYSYRFDIGSQKLGQKVNLVLHGQAHLQHLQPPSQIISVSHLAPSLHQRSRKRTSHDFISQRLAFRQPLHGELLQQERGELSVIASAQPFPQSRSDCPLHRQLRPRLSRTTHCLLRMRSHLWSSHFDLARVWRLQAFPAQSSEDHPAAVLRRDNFDQYDLSAAGEAEGKRDRLQFRRVGRFFPRSAVLLAQLRIEKTVQFSKRSAAHCGRAENEGIRAQSQCAP